MIAAIRRFITAVRGPVVRYRAFPRRPRVRTGRLPNLTPEQQVAYDRACRFLRESYLPVTGEKGR